VQFELGTPLGGFIEAARQPLLPAHLLDGVAAADLGTHPFGRAPVGAGPYRLVSLDAERALLEPADDGGPPAATPSPTAGSPDPLATPPRPAVDPPPDRPADLEVSFHDDALALEGAWTDGEVDVASGLAPDVATRLDASDARIVRYPTTTLTTVLLNQRLDHPELRDRAVRRGLLQGIDREALVSEAWNGLAALAAAPIPPSSWAFDPDASTPVPFDRLAAAAALDTAGWTPADGRWTAPGGTEPYTMELLSPDVASSTTTFEAASSVAADLRRLGLTVEHVALPPAELVGERLRAGRFDAAVVDVNVGLDPDLYPLLASSQTRSTGLNFSGVVEPDLDRLLVAARTPGAAGTRLSAHTALQERLAGWQYLLPLAFRDEVMLVRNTVSGVTPRLIGEAGDRFHDVLAWRLADDRGGG
jgi:ABC-type transport system substrate-binding protein